MIWKTTMLSKSLKWQFQNNQMMPVPKPTNWPMASAKWPMPTKPTGQQGAVLLSVEAGFGFKTAGKEQNQNYRQSREKQPEAGGDINIRSREGDITVQGSNITAGDTIRLDSARDIRLLSAQDSQHQDGKNRNAGVGRLCESCTF